MSLETASCRRNYSAKYLYYLNEYHMRLRKSAAAPPADAAGLLGGARYHGRNTPLKGKGRPPSDDLEEVIKRGQHKVPGHSWQPSDVLLQSRPATADATSPRPKNGNAGKDSISCQRSSLRGSAASVETESQPVTPRRSRGAGASSPLATLALTHKHIANDGYTSGELREVAPIGLRTYQTLIRPSTADNDSIIRHRYSLPDTKPSPMKLDAHRPALPLVNQQASEEESRAVFFAAFDDYCWNKTKALYGGRFRMG